MLQDTNNSKMSFYSWLIKWHLELFAVLVHRNLSADPAWQHAKAIAIVISIRKSLKGVYIMYPLGYVVGVEEVQYVVDKWKKKQLFSILLLFLLLLPTCLASLELLEVKPLTSTPKSFPF